MMGGLQNYSFYHPLNKITYFTNFVLKFIYFSKLQLPWGDRHLRGWNIQGKQYTFDNYYSIL